MASAIAWLIARHHDEADFLAPQEFLDHDGMAGGAETAAEHGRCRGDGRLMRLANDDALAGGQSVGLDDQRQALRPHIASASKFAAVKVAKLAVGMRWR